MAGTWAVDTAGRPWALVEVTGTPTDAVAGAVEKLVAMTVWPCGLMVVATTGTATAVDSIMLPCTLVELTTTGTGVTAGVEFSVLIEGWVLRGVWGTRALSDWRAAGAL